MRTFPQSVLDAISSIALTLMNYDPDTGYVSWRPGRKYAKRKPGERLGCSDQRKGYRVIYITIPGRTVQVKEHRLAWLIFYGVWPDGEIDHINHDTADNRMINLRCVSGAENSKNASLRKTNKSGYTGVHYCKRARKWKAQHNVSGKRMCVGLFGTAEEANTAVSASRAAHGYHRNHGID